MLLNHSKVTSNNQNNVAHIDNKYFNSYSGIYYVNDSDGDTIIYNEKWSSQNPYRPENLTENTVYFAIVVNTTQICPTVC